MKRINCWIGQATYNWYISRVTTGISFSKE